jgi:light-regulated signal transduction histidine kinase (bacteriophytochrome)
MNGMLEGLLALARLGGAAIDPAPVDMTALANATAQSAKEQSAVSVTINIEKLPIAIGSDVLLRQVWTNLLVNAVKFSSPRTVPTIDVGSIVESEQTRYFVRDNGVGFDMAKADQLFMAFRRLHSEKEFSGVGVGLAIVNRIVSQHGGRVWAESELDKGATFYFTLGLSLPKELGNTNRATTERR